MNIVRSLKYLVLSAVVGLSLAPGAQAADKLTLIYTTSSATFALPVLIAEQKGWLDAKIITVAGDSNGIRALLAGTGDVTFPGPFSVFSAANEGAKITAIGSWQGGADYKDRKSTSLNSSH